MRRLRRPKWWRTAARRRRRQITCWCWHYGFPHRIGGGACTGADWARTYFEHDSSCCRQCTSNDGHGLCDVASGAERIKYCDGMRDYLRAGDHTRYPPLDDNRDDQAEDPDWADHARAHAEGWQ